MARTRRRHCGNTVAWRYSVAEDTEVTYSAHLQTYGSEFFVLCSLYFIVRMFFVLCSLYFIVPYVFRSLFIVFHCIVHCHCPVRLFSFLYGTSIKARGFAWFVDAKASSAYPRNKEEEFSSAGTGCFCVAYLSTTVWWRS